MKSKKTNKNSSYGEVDLLDKDAFAPKETKFRVTMFLDLDVLNEIRKKAKEKGLPYQTYINLFLREHHLNEENPLLKRIEAIESQLKQLKAG
jgi:hypothetical protein